MRLDFGNGKPFNKVELCWARAFGKRYRLQERFGTSGPWTNIPGTLETDGDGSYDVLTFDCWKKRTATK